MGDENEITKLRVKLGGAEVEYEGSQSFLKAEIMPTVDKIIELVKVQTDLQREPATLQLESGRLAPDSQGDSPKPTGSLASYLKAKGGSNKQIVRFLATAAWLSGRGNKDLTAALVAKALQENQQSRLANPADCLNKNVAKGYCEKTKDGFFITPEGWSALEQLNESE